VELSRGLKGRCGTRAVKGVCPCGVLGIEVSNGRYNSTCKGWALTRRGCVVQSRLESTTDRVVRQRGEVPGAGRDWRCSRRYLLLQAWGRYSIQPEYIVPLRGSLVAGVSVGPETGRGALQAEAGCERRRRRRWRGRRGRQVLPWAAKMMKKQKQKQTQTPVWSARRTKQRLRARSRWLALSIRVYPRATVHNSMSRYRRPKAIGGGTIRAIRARREQKGGALLAHEQATDPRAATRQIAALVFVVVLEGVGGWRS